MFKGIKMKIEQLKENKLYIFEGKILRLIKSPYNKNGQQQGLRSVLKQLDKEELNKIPFLI